MHLLLVLLLFGLLFSFALFSNFQHQLLRLVSLLSLLSISLLAHYRICSRSQTPCRQGVKLKQQNNKITDNKEIGRLQQESNSMLARSQTPRQTYRPGPKKAVSRFFAAGVELHAGKEPSSTPSTKQQATRKFIVCSRSPAPRRQGVKLHTKQQTYKLLLCSGGPLGAHRSFM